MYIIRQESLFSIQEIYEMEPTQIYEAIIPIPNCMQLGYSLSFLQ